MQEPMKKERPSLVCSVLWNLLLVHLLSLTTTGSAATIQGEFGGNVTFQCQSDEQQPLYMLYLQKQINTSHQIAINGYHRNKPVVTGYQERSQVDHTRRTIEMWNLTFSDSGLYHCYIVYNTEKGPGPGAPETTFTLEVKPKPTLSVKSDCQDDSFCVVSCAANGGYPERKVTWNVTESETWRLQNIKEDSKVDPDSQLFNITSTVSVNCTSGGPLFLRCSVGDVTSTETSVCNGTPTERPPYPPIYAAVGVLAVVIAAALLFTLIRRKCKPPCPDDAETGPTNPGEDIALNRMDQP